MRKDTEQTNFKKLGIFDFINYTVISAFTLFCLAPLVLIGAISITDERTLARFGYSFIPKKVSFEAYGLIFSSSNANTGMKDLIANSLVANSYVVTLLVTLLGTTVSVVITAMAAYTLSNKNVKIRGTLSFYFYFTMLFSPGLVPVYILCHKLHLVNNVFALIVPFLLFNPFYLFLTRNFMSGIPDSLMESARIDGANDLFIAFRIYLPLCLPVLAAITLFYGIGYWNDWFNAIMFVDKPNLYPLQYLLFKIQSELKALEALQQITGVVTDYTPPSESLKMATAVITIGPIIFLYPFLQKYFVKGLIMGSVKG